MGTVILTYADQTEYLNHQNGWVVYRFSKSKRTFKIFAGPTRKDAPKPRLMKMKEIESDYDPNKNDGN